MIAACSDWELTDRWNIAKDHLWRPCSDNISVPIAGCLVGDFPRWLYAQQWLSYHSIRKGTNKKWKLVVQWWDLIAAHSRWSCREGRSVVSLLMIIVLNLSPHYIRPYCILKSQWWAWAWTGANTLAEPLIHGKRRKSSIPFASGHAGFYSMFRGRLIH